MPKVKLSEFHRTRSRPEAKSFLLWDTTQKGLALQVRPNGYRAFKVICSFHNRVRWLHLGDATAIDLVQARELANDAMFKVAKGKDPQAEKKAQRSAGTFAELADRYRDEHAKIHNKSYKQVVQHVSGRHAGFVEVPLDQMICVHAGITSVMCIFDQGFVKMACALLHSLDSIRSPRQRLCGSFKNLEIDKLSCDL